MKKKILSLILALALVLPIAPTELFNITADAAITSGTSGYYTYSVSNGEATITAVHSSISGDIVIPSKLGWNNYSVVGIGYGAFLGCSSLTSVKIPDSVTSIGENAFQSCTSLESITIPNGVTVIGGNAFFSCTSLTSIEIPDSIISIGNGAFHNCSSLTSITIPDSVASIGNYAFARCTGLTSVSIGNGVTFIGENAFNGCTSLTSITIPDGIVTINNHTFSQCLALKSITIPDSVTSIGNSALYACSSLTSIALPDSVTLIDTGAFDFCNALTDVWYEGTEEAHENISIRSSNAMLKSATWHYNSCIKNPSAIKVHIYDKSTGTTCTECGATREHPYDACGTTGNCTWTLDGTVLTISGKGAMGDLPWNANRPPWGSAITEVIIEDGVTTIGDYAFHGCDNLTSIEIPDSVTKIVGAAFWGCSSLVSITIPNGVEHLEHYAFAQCTSLASVTIPDSMVEINSYSFYDCDKLKDVWYAGTSDGRREITENYTHCPLTYATWHYNSCVKNPANEKVHIYDNACDTTCNLCGAERQVPDHTYDDAKDLICNECGYERPPFTPGDVDGVEGVTLDDAIYLLYHVNFKDTYLVNQPVDFNGDGKEDLDDAIYLLYHVNFKETYPLH